jgi:uncharacterized protein
MATSFEVSPRNKVLRMAKRAAYDRDAVYSIVDEALVCHVGYVIDGQPYVIPTLHARDGEVILLHGHGTARTLLHAGADNPVCIAVTHVDGVVLARSIFNHSINYRSATLYGTGRLLTDPDEKMDALFRFSENVASRPLGRRSANERHRVQGDRDHRCRDRASRRKGP